MNSINLGIIKRTSTSSNHNKCHNALHRIKSSPIEINQTLTLPKIPSRMHPDLNVIHPSIILDLIHGKYPIQYMLIDCRFYYEHIGGNIEGSHSIWHPDQIEKEFFTSPITIPTALIFYCEFSMHRAPNLIRHLRKLDRRIHYECYPKLFYPEIYLIDGGYKHCYETIQEICTPKGYVKMDDVNFKEICETTFRSLRKSWKTHTIEQCAAKWKHLSPVIQK